MLHTLMDYSKKPTINHDFSTETFANEVLVYDEKTAKAFYLNDTAFAVMQLCNEDMTIGQIITCLEQAYPDQKDRIAGDVVNALEKLAASGVVIFADE